MLDEKLSTTWHGTAGQNSIIQSGHLDLICLAILESSLVSGKC